MGFAAHDYKMSTALVYEAAPALWHNHVQCTSVVDSNSANRACCACYEGERFCPLGGPDFPRADSGYCAEACRWGVDEACKYLRAGCGVNLMDVGARGWAADRCDGRKVREGRCTTLCGTPNWCDEPGNFFSDVFGAQTAAGWMRQFSRRSPGHRQCKWKAAQRERWVEVTRAYLGGFKRRPDEAVLCIENEVSMYVGPGDGGTKEALAEHLLGLVLLRTTDDGTWIEPQTNAAVLRQLAAQFRRLGREVPIYVLTNEAPARLDLWRPDARVDVRAPPYDLAIMPAEAVP